MTAAAQSCTLQVSAAALTRPSSWVQHAMDDSAGCDNGRAIKMLPCCQAPGTKQLTKRSRQRAQCVHVAGQKQTAPSSSSWPVRLALPTAIRPRRRDGTKEEKKLLSSSTTTRALIRGCTCIDLPHPLANRGALSTDGAMHADHGAAWGSLWPRPTSAGHGPGYVGWLDLTCNTNACLPWPLTPADSPPYLPNQPCMPSSPPVLVRNRNPPHPHAPGLHEAVVIAIYGRLVLLFGSIDMTHIPWTRPSPRATADITSSAPPII